MRTTLSLEDDVAAQLNRVRKARHWGLKQAVNAALREGLAKMLSPAAPRAPFRTQAADLGRCYLASLDDVSDVLAAAEGERFK